MTVILLSVRSSQEMAWSLRGLFASRGGTLAKGSADAWEFSEVLGGSAACESPAALGALSTAALASGGLFFSVTAGDGSEAGGGGDPEDAGATFSPRRGGGVSVAGRGFRTPEVVGLVDWVGLDAFCKGSVCGWMDR
jgi:hypothetical protein